MPLDPFLMNYLLTGQISKKQQEKMDSAEQNAIESGMEPEEAKNLATEAFSKPLDPQNYSLTGQTRFPEPRPFDDVLTAPRLEEKKNYRQFGNPNNEQWPSTQEVYLDDFPRSDQVAKSEEATKPEEATKSEEAIKPEETDKPEDVAAAQAIAGAKQTKVNPDESKQLNKDLEKASSQKAQEDIEKAIKDPRAYLMEKYKIGDKSQELEKLQKRNNILESVSDLDKALGQLGSWKYVLAKKMGYDVPGYKGGGLADIAAKEKQQFSEKLAMDQAERDQLTKAFAAEKTEKEFKQMLEDNKELDNPNGMLANSLKDAAETLNMTLPEGITPRQILRVMPEIAKLAEQRKAKAAEIEAKRGLEEFKFGKDIALEREKQKGAMELKKMEMEGKKSERTEEQKALGKKTAEELAETKGFNETIQLLDSLSETKQILGKVDPRTGKKSAKASDRVSGGLIGLLPNFARRLVSTPSSKVESDISGVLALPNLKAVFGGNPTEGERKTLLETLFDGVQDESEILRRVESLERRMLASAKENDRKKKWIADHGNLDKYTPALPEGISAVTKELAAEFGVKSADTPKASVTNPDDPRIDQFMKANGIESRDEAINILKNQGIIK